MSDQYFRIIPRSEWGARYGRGNDVSRNLPWSEAVIHTEAGAVRPRDWPAITEAARTMTLTEKQHIQAIERYHSVTLGWSGIGYSFLISRDGSIFEGRGWGRSGAHTENRNSTAVGICFLGHGDIQPATEAQWLAAAWLIKEGQRLKKLTAAPKVSGHRNYSKKGKTCPGNLIYPHIQRLAGIRPGSNVPTSPPRPNPTPTTGRPTIRKGSSGRDVTDAQRMLNIVGGAGISDDGRFGPATEQAVRNFQKFFKLKDDGVVGPATWKALEYFYSLKVQKPKPVGPAPTPVLRQGAAGAAVEDLQHKLKIVSGVKLDEDGKFGPATKEAVTNFQAFFKLVPFGVVGKDTWGLLNYLYALKIK